MEREIIIPDYLEITAKGQPDSGPQAELCSKEGEGCCSPSQTHRFSHSCIHTPREKCTSES